MKLYALLGGAAALVALTSFVTASLVAPAQERAAAQEEMPSMEEMMAEMARLAAPGKPHEALQASAGTWDVQYKMRMAPDADWMEMTGVTKRSMLLGGRYALDEIEWSMMGMPVQGIAIYGYDNLEQEYVSLWMDSWSTWPISSRGKQLEDGSIEFHGTMVDIAGERPFRMVLHPGEDEATMEMYDTIPPQGEVLMMTVTSTRRQ